MKKAKKAPAKTEMVCQNDKCHGRSECKGMGNDACKGENDCAGKGWLTAADAKECESKQGKWVAKK